MSYIYSNAFLSNVDKCAKISAQEFIKNIDFKFNINSVLDVGCGRGAWLKEWESNNVNDILGIDGEYVDLKQILVKENQFKYFDIQNNFDLKRKYDLATCLEVGEHIEKIKSEVLVQNLVRHSDMILFSAALPGQGGTNHINEQDHRFWINLFEKYDYIPFDYPRLRIMNNIKIMPWYRYNLMLFVKSEKVNYLSQDIKNTQITKNYNLYDLIRTSWKLRLFFLKFLPVKILTLLSKIKYYIN